MIAIWVDQSSSNSALNEHRCLRNITNLYKSANKCDYQQQYISILEEIMVYTHEGITENSPIALGTLGSPKKKIARKLLSQFSALVYAKQKKRCPHNGGH